MIRKNFSYSLQLLQIQKFQHRGFIRYLYSMFAFSLFQLNIKFF